MHHAMLEVLGEDHILLYAACKHSLGVDYLWVRVVVSCGLHLRGFLGERHCWRPIDVSANNESMLRWELPLWFVIEPPVQTSPENPLLIIEWSLLIQGVPCVCVLYHQGDVWCGRAICIPLCFDFWVVVPTTICHCEEVQCIKLICYGLLPVITDTI